MQTHSWKVEISPALEVLEHRTESGPVSAWFHFRSCGMQQPGQILLVPVPAVSLWAHQKYTERTDEMPGLNFESNKCE